MYSEKRERNSTGKKLGSPACAIGLILAISINTVLTGKSIRAEELPSNLETLTFPDTNVVLSRGGNRLFVQMESEPENREISIPRVFASLMNVHFLGESPDKKLIVHPEPNDWFIRWKPGLKFRNVVVLEFDDKPLFSSEISAASQRGDGTILLHAHQAKTSGEKLRYEPQPHKNTVGYWTIPEDTATWTLRIDRPGEFNVGILQGCGKGQGGSEGVVTIKNANGDTQAIEFNTVDTGHFQNFVWRDIGSLRFPDAGEWELVVKPKKIAKGALMDVRIIHLSPKR